MKRVLVLLAACATPVTPEPERNASAVDEPARLLLLDQLLASPPVPSPMPAPAYARDRSPVSPAQRPLTAIHGDMIRAVASTDDGVAAVSADNSGGVRLWPTLDGTREPVVIAMRAPRTLAIAHTRAGFVIAGLDELGQLEIVRVSEEGAGKERIAVDAPRPIVAVRVVAGGVVAERDDHVIAVFDHRGALRGELAPESGERIIDLPTRRDRVLALIERDGVVSGRWIAFGEHVAWGARTPRLPIDARPVALAPDGARIAATRRRGRDIVVVSLARGRVVESDVQAAADPTALALGFIDDGTFAFEVGLQIVLRSAGTTVSSNEPSSLPLAITDGQAVFGEGQELVLLAGDNVRHVLGYRTATLASLLADDDGWIASSGNEAMTLDASLRADHVFDLADPARPQYGWRQLSLLDRHTALAFAQSALYMIDLDGARKASPTGTTALGSVEPRTGLVVSWAKQKQSMARYDAATKTLSKFIAIPPLAQDGTWHSAYIALLDPETTGNVASIIEYGKDDVVTITDIVAFDPTAAEPFRLAPARTVKMTAEQRDLRDPRELVTGRSSARSKSPDGALVADLANNRLTLHTRGGVERWTVPSNGATAIAWSRSGELVVYGSGAARVDLATGALRERVCGWHFGLWDDHSGSFGSARLCEAP